MTQDILYRYQYPSFIVVCISASDIQLSVGFASLYNIQISICSTGHSYSGRNTANNSLQINLSLMKSYDLDLSSNTITVETGLQWGDIYPIVDNVNRIVIGGSDPGVGPGGYSLGGGHSPLSPSFGLASDFTTDYYIVDANANIVYIYNTSGDNTTIDDLYWSLKGGGGGTFGVVINITFMLHEPIKNYKYTQLICEYRFWEHPYSRSGQFLAELILNNLFDIITENKLDSNWGGYTLKNLYIEGLFFSWLYYGDPVDAEVNAQLVYNLSYPYNNSANTNCSLAVYDTFWGYESNIDAAGAGKEYTFNSLVPKHNLTADYANLITRYYNSSNIWVDGFGIGQCWIFQGGKVNERDNDFTSVTPAFRHNYFEMDFAVVWANDSAQNNAISNANKYEQELRNYGEGIYGNEENYDCINCNWKYQFWGDHYDDLLAVKQKWDPNQVFWCHHCVGDE